jgi:uncharacterized membrane protein YfcA
MTFPGSGVETQPWVPPLVAFAVSFLCSMGGVSGAFLLLPFQVSVLGFTSPAVSPTNLVFNIVAIPSGVLRYIREGRMIWPLTLIVIAGTLPGVFLGGFVRLRYLPDPGPFKVFAGLVLLYIALQLLRDVLGRGHSTTDKTSRAEETEADWVVSIVEFTARRLAFRFRSREHSCSTPGIWTLSVIVGLVGGIYGIGGGAIIAPFLVAIFGLPVYVIAGAALMGTLVSSVAGVLFFQFLGPFFAPGGVAVAPDWLLGALFGVGGIVGMYLGARAQRFVPATAIKLLLCLILVSVAVQYLGAFFLS